jgi:hypothetical protein
MAIGLVTAGLLAAMFLWPRNHNRIAPLDGKDLLRLKRYSDEMYRESVLPFE